MKGRRSGAMEKLHTLDLPLRGALSEREGNDAVSLII